MRKAMRIGSYREAPRLNETFIVALDQDSADLAGHFLRNRQRWKQQWREAAAGGNVDVLRRAGQGHKGTASTFGFQCIADLEKTLEEAVVGGDLAEAQGTLGCLIDFIDRATSVPR